MPQYSFACEKCCGKFEIKKPINQAGQIPRCVRCNSKKYVYRDYLADNIQVQEAQKTVGSLADKNSSVLSDDAKCKICKDLDPRTESTTNNKER